MEILLNDHTFILLHEKALFKPAESLLVIADIHLGKAAHFRKEGISIPAHTQHTDYEKLRRLFERMQPERVFFLGDLFHSTFNRDWHYFAELIQQFPAIHFTLIKGNHDIINKKLFHDLNISFEDHVIEDDHFVYSHEPRETVAHKINIAGHIHPGVRLSGIANQSVRLQCFYHSGNTFLLPSFGSLTGAYSLPRTKDTTVYAVLPTGIKRL